MSDIGFPKVASSQSSTALTSMESPSTRLSSLKSPCTMHGGPAHASAAGACSCSHLASCSISGRRGFPSVWDVLLAFGVVQVMYCCSQRFTCRAQNACGLPKDARPTADGSTECSFASVSACTVLHSPHCCFGKYIALAQLQSDSTSLCTVKSLGYSTGVH